MKPNLDQIWYEEFGTWGPNLNQPKKTRKKNQAVPIPVTVIYKHNRLLWLAIGMAIELGLVFAVTALWQ